MCQQRFVLLVGCDMHRIHELSCRGISGSMTTPSSVHSTSTVQAVTWELFEADGVRSWTKEAAHWLGLRCWIRVVHGAPRVLVRAHDTVVMSPFILIASCPLQQPVPIGWSAGAQHASRLCLYAATVELTSAFDHSRSRDDN